MPSHKLKIFFEWSLGIFVVVFLIWLAFAPDRWVYRQQFEVSELIIQEADAFRNTHGYMPKSEELASLMSVHGWKLSEECPCYKTLTESSYIVWFGYATVGTSMVYHSESKQWSIQG